MGWWLNVVTQDSVRDLYAGCRFSGEVVNMKLDTEKAEPPVKNWQRFSGTILNSLTAHMAIIDARG